MLPLSSTLRKQSLSLACAEADDNPMAGAVIGGSLGEEGFRAYIGRFKDEDAIKGVRQVLHVPDAEPGHCACRSSFVRDVQYLGEIGMSFDLCLRPGELGDAVGLVDQCPDTLFIVDHCGNADPQIVNGAAEHDPASPYQRAVAGRHSRIGRAGTRSLQNIRDRRSGTCRVEVPTRWHRRSITVWTALGRTGWCSAATGRCATLGRVWGSGWLRCGRSSPGGRRKSRPNCSPAMPSGSTDWSEYGPF